MKIACEQLARQLESELGATAVQRSGENLATYTVDGRKPALLCIPDAPDQLVAALRVCSDAEAAMIPWGGGTAMAVGNPPRACDVVIALNRLNRLLEHDDANLTITVEAGMSLAELQAITARQHQFTPFDPPHAERATIGGIVAANLNGPRRMSHGSVRDLVTGMKVVLPSGEQIKAGGKVVKNVAGYDMCKLFVGSLGTLGIVKEVTLRVAPAPERAATLLASGTSSQVIRVSEQIARSPLLPAAAVILKLEPKEMARYSLQPWAIAAWTEGFAESVSRHLNDLKDIAVRNGLTADTFESYAHTRFWGTIRDFPLMPDRLVYRLTLPRASIPGLEQAWQNWQISDGSPGLIADAAAGTVWVSVAAQRSAGERFSKLISFARDCGGHAVIFAAPANVKDGVDVWGTAPTALSLMREVKRQFDPKGLLNPGRFVSGI
ncbi:MAG TPA: FAD-binding oxidoreductase [Candidatus Binatia bacterium]|nr:FAD-binding oxidoreductase [Candidatus Binatia bacterium]